MRDGLFYNHHRSFAASHAEAFKETEVTKKKKKKPKQLSFNDKVT